MANSYLSRTVGSAGNRKTMTFSFWLKRTKISDGANPCVICDEQASYPTHKIAFESDDTLHIRSAVGTNDSAADQISARTYRKFRDTSSWYHFVIAIDTTQGSDANKVKLYVNGEQNLSWQSAPACSQNLDTQFNTAQAIYIGNLNGAYSDMNLAHYHFVDGTAYAPTKFGEVDSTTGEWKPILSPASVSYGDNGFFLKFENAGALGADSSGESNTFAVSGNLKQSISTPSNNFLTFDENQAHNQTPIMAGTGLSSSTSGWTSANTNYAMLKGKWYAEFKCVSGTYRGVGIFRYGGNYCADIPNKNVNSGMFPEGYFYKADQKQLSNNNSETTYSSWSAINDGDVLMMAVDLDNGKIWYGVNGTWNNLGSGVGVPNTGAYPHQTFTVGTGNFWGVCAGGHTNPVIHANFGEGRFGTSALSSAVNDNGGKGTFEYTPPAGFYSICTKNIKTYG